MGRTALRRATVVLTAALVLTVTFSPSLTRPTPA